MGDYLEMVRHLTQVAEQEKRAPMEAGMMGEKGFQGALSPCKNTPGDTDLETARDSF